MIDHEFVWNDRPKGSRWWWYPENETLVRTEGVGEWFDGPGGALTRECRMVPRGPTTYGRIGFRPWLRLKISTRFREDETPALRRMLKKLERE